MWQIGHSPGARDWTSGSIGQIQRSTEPIVARSRARARAKPETSAKLAASRSSTRPAITSHEPRPARPPSLPAGAGGEAPEGTAPPEARSVPITSDSTLVTTCGAPTRSPHLEGGVGVVASTDLDAVPLFALGR